MTIAGASLEVIEHHAKEHARTCASIGGIDQGCPCGLTRVLICGTCKEIVFLVVRPETWCEHAQQVIDYMREPG